MLTEDYIRETEKELKQIVAQKGNDRKLLSLYHKCIFAKKRLQDAKKELTSRHRNPDNPSDWWELNICKSRVLFYEKSLETAYYDLRTAIARKEYSHLLRRPPKAKPTKNTQKTKAPQ